MLHFDALTRKNQLVIGLGGVVDNAHDLELHAQLGVFQSVLVYPDIQAGGIDPKVLQQGLAQTQIY